MIRRSIVFLIVLIPFSQLISQSTSNYIEETKSTITELIEFVAIPNDAIHPKDIDKNIAWLHDAYKSRGFTTRTLETSNLPLFFAEMHIDNTLPTILFYAHLDGQAVDPSKWDQKDPYQVVLKEKKEDGSFENLSMKMLNGELHPDWRLFGRSAADDKAPIVSFLHTIDLMKRSNIHPQCNIKVILDSEEEKGSAPLPAAVRKYKETLSADLLIINDGPIHLSNRPTIIYGCRGIMHFDLTVYGPGKSQHSGHYGNYAPNPSFRLAHLLSSMKDEYGKVLIDGYYDGIRLDEITKEKLAAVPDDEKNLHELLQIAEPEKVGSNYQESLQYPSLNVRGMASAWVGEEARTIVPDKAMASIDVRLVPESKPDRLMQLIQDHIRLQGYYIINREPTKEERLTHPKIAKLELHRAVLPFRTDMNSPVAQWLGKTLDQQFGEKPVEVRIMGGTVPVSAFINELNIPSVIMPVVNADNNQHAPNENMRIGNITTALRTFYSILSSPVSF